MNADTRALVIFLLIGLVAGWLASVLVGGFLLNALGLNLGIRNALASQIVTATIGAIVVVLLARIIA